MSELVTYNKFMTEPFPDTSAKVESHGAGEFKVVKIANTRANLVGLKTLALAVIPTGGKNMTVEAGTTIYVRADLYATFKDVYKTKDGTPFVILPVDRVEYMEGV